MDRRLEVMKAQEAARQALWSRRLDALRSASQWESEEAKLAEVKQSIEHEKAAEALTRADLEEAEQSLLAEQQRLVNEGERLVEVKRIRAELDARQAKLEKNRREAADIAAKLQARDQKLRKLQREQEAARLRIEEAEARVRAAKAQRRAEDWQQCSASGELWEPHKYTVELARARDAGEPTVTVGAGTGDERVVHFAEECEVKDGEMRPIRDRNAVPPAWLWLEEHCPQPFACPFVYSRLGAAGHEDDPRSENLPTTSLEYKTQSEAFIKNYKW
jgi:hypothetical protein